MSETMTAQRIAEIRERLTRITPAPWAWESTGEKSNDYAVGTAYDPDGNPISGRIVCGDDPDAGVWLEDAIVRRHLIGEGEGNFADADFIAHAPDDVRDLLAAYERLAQERDALDRIQRENAEAMAMWAGRALKAEAQLTAVRALVEKWRESETEGHAHDPAVAFAEGVLQCADELAACLAPVVTETITDG